MSRRRDLALLDEAIALEAEAQQALLAGAVDMAGAAFRAAAGRYRASWEAAPPRAYGRLVGELKAAVLGGEAVAAATHARAAIGKPDSPTSAYALAIAALVEGDDATASAAAEAMRGGSDAFARAADAVSALAAGDGAAYARAVGAIVADFEERERHLTGVAIADTALMLERLAAERGLQAGIRSRVLPASG
jgi:hypothetical protein